MGQINLIGKIRKRLRSSLGRTVEDTGYRYHRYRPGDSVIEDFAEFSGVPLDVVAEKIANYYGINADDWHAADAKLISERTATFYQSSQNFIYGILAGNPKPETVVKKLNTFNPRMMAAIRAHPGKRFFEFGGGIGVFCEIAARMGKDVYYMELPGIVFDFALWRFKRHGLKVTSIEAMVDRIYLPGKYDIVYSDAVIEHLPPTQQVEAIRAIGRAVDAHGLLVILIDLSGPTVEDPTHYEVDIRALHDCLFAEGLYCEDGHLKFCSIWRRS
jgi:2-polyprenyl-3-methyl-5-hydroxy-6-metoxy-1,4-benzoquinol methylase